MPWATKAIGGCVTNGGFYEYDPAQNTWTLTAYYRGGNAFLGSAFTAGNKGYLLVPDVDGITHLKTDLWEFTPQSNFGVGVRAVETPICVSSLNKISW